MSALTDALDAMFETAPRDWWQFTPCEYCMAKRQEPCLQGCGGWPDPARHPHASRIRSAQVLHETLWLLGSGFRGDVVGPDTPTADVRGGLGATHSPRVAPGATTSPVGPQIDAQETP